MKFDLLPSKKTVGVFGEELVEKKYNSKGYETLAKNFKHNKGEIDLILKKKDLIIFTEVKTRTDFADIHPSEAVDYIKRKKIIQTAKFYCFDNKIDESDFFFRFDVANVYVYSYPEKYKIEIFENAFDEKGKIL